MIERPRYRVTIEQVIREVHEIVLDGSSAMDALDEARALVQKRNESSHTGKYHVTKVETVKEEDNELSSDVSARQLQREHGDHEGQSGSTDWVCGHQGEPRQE